MCKVAVILHRYGDMSVRKVNITRFKWSAVTFTIAHTHTQHTLLRTPITGYKNKELEWRARQLVSSSARLIPLALECSLLCWLYAQYLLPTFICLCILPAHPCVRLSPSHSLSLSVCVCFHFYFVACFKISRCTLFSICLHSWFKRFPPACRFFPFLFSVSVCCWFFFLRFLTRFVRCVVFCVCSFFFF